MSKNYGRARSTIDTILAMGDMAGYPGGGAGAASMHTVPLPSTRVRLPPGFNVFAAPPMPQLNVPPPMPNVAAPRNLYPTRLDVVGHIDADLHPIIPVPIHHSITRYSLPPGIVQWIFPKNAAGLLRINDAAIEEITGILNKILRREDDQPVFMMERIRTMYKPPESHRSIHHAPFAWKHGVVAEEAFYQTIYNATPEYASVSREVEIDLPYIMFRPGTIEEEDAYESHVNQHHFDFCRFVPTSSTTGEVHIYDNVPQDEIEILLRILTDYESKRRMVNIMFSRKGLPANVSKEVIGSFLMGKRHKNATKKKPPTLDPGGGSTRNRRRRRR